MKKILVLLLCLLLASCNPKITISEENYQSITYDEVKEKIENDETFVFYIGQDSCSSCREYIKTLKTYFETNNDKKIYYLNYDENFLKGMPNEGKQVEFSDKAYEMLGKKYYEDYGYQKEYLYTPTTFKVVRGEYVRCLIGELNINLIDEMFDFPLDNNIIRNNLSFEEVKANIDNLEDSIFYLSQKNCSACSEFEYILDHHEKLNSEVKIGNLDYALIKDNQDAQDYLLLRIVESTGNLDYLVTGFFTPTIFKIKDGNLEVIVGLPSEEEIENLLK